MPIIGPISATPSSAQATPATQAAQTVPRADRERSPRREHEQVPVPDLEEAESVPVLTAAQEAAIRGDHIDTNDSLPEIEEVPFPTETASNARGGASFT